LPQDHEKQAEAEYFQLMMNGAEIGPHPQLPSDRQRFKDTPTTFYRTSSHSAPYFQATAVLLYKKTLVL